MRTGDDHSRGHRDLGKLVLGSSRPYLVLVTAGNEFGLLLQRLRKDAKLSQEEAASEAGISEAYWGGIERGQTGLDSVSFETLWAMVTAVTKSHQQRLALLRLAGGKHEEIANEVYAAASSEGTVPPLEAVIEASTELHSAEDRSALKHMVRTMKLRPQPFPVPEETPEFERDEEVR